jgi:hypothetical protein
VRTRKKLFEYKTWKLTPEVFIEPPQGNREIVAAVREYIEDCRRELPRRYIDASMFEAEVSYINWVALLSAGRRGSAADHTGRRTGHRRWVV